MPNWCTTRVLIAGPGPMSRKFAAAFGRMMVNSISRPFYRCHPPWRKSTSTKKIMNWAPLCYVFGGAGTVGLGGRMLLRHALTGEEAPTVELVRAYLDSHPAVEQAGRRGLRATAEHGAMHWYEWNCRHWGTKWNASGTQITTADPLNFTIDTAWGPPLPVLAKANEMFGTLTLDCSYIEPGWNFSGQRIYCNGVTMFEANADATDEMYLKVYGYKETSRSKANVCLYSSSYGEHGVRVAPLD